MDAKNIIQEKIEIIKNEVDFILEKYHGDSDDSKGSCFQDVEKVKQDIERTLWLAVENYETPNDLPACNGEFEYDGNRFLITLKEGDAILEVYVYIGDLVDGYNEENVGSFEAFDVSLKGCFEITRNGLWW